MNKKYFITGIGTDIGKTIVSAIFVEALKADYWKPVQAGSLDNTDTDTVKNLISNNVSFLHPETYRLKTSASPHFSAEKESVKIDPERFIVPETSNCLIIEGAGGLMVPLNSDFFVIDLIEKLKAEVILVSQNYLGSINHTLLSYELLKKRSVPVKGIVFNDAGDEASEKLILEYTELPCLLKVKKEDNIDKNTILLYSEILKRNL